jgi:hypothetical protein
LYHFGTTDVPKKTQSGRQYRADYAQMGDLQVSSQFTCRKNLKLIRFSESRFLFTSGAVKLASGCPTWWNLMGLSRHFETMPLPTPLSWYAHHLPESILKLTTVYVHLSELVIPWLFFAPARAARKFAFYWLVRSNCCHFGVLFSFRLFIFRFSYNYTL